MSFAVSPWSGATSVAVEASDTVLNSLFTMEFWENAFSELLFVAVLLVAYAIGKHQSQTAQRKAAERNKQKVDISAVAKKQYCQAYEHGDRACVQVGVSPSNPARAVLGGRRMTEPAAAESQGHQALKTAIRQQDVEGVLRAFCSLHDSSLTEGVSDGIPQNLRDAAIQTVSQCGKFAVLMDTLRNSRVSTRTLNAMLKDCARRESFAELQACREYGYELKIPFNCASYSILVESVDSSQVACALFEEAAASSVRMGRLCEVAAERAEKRDDGTLAQLVLRHLPDGGVPSAATVAAILHQRAKAVLSVKQGEDGMKTAVDAAVLDLFEAHFSNVDLSTCPRARQIVLDAALRVGRGSVVASMLEPEGGAAAAVRSAPDGAEARRVFELCPSKTSHLYQVLIDVLLGHGDVQAAEKVLDEAAKAGVADAALYQGVAMVQARRGATQNARACLTAMRAAGFQPTVKVLNELLEKTLKSGARDIWNTVREIEIKPDSGTCRVLLEHGPKRHDFIAKVVALAERVDDLSDVFGLLLETMMRNDGGKLLVPILQRQRGPNKVLVRDSITYAHLVRAYGVIEDTDGAWEAWREMISRNMMPLKVTLGCMVQALVANRQPEAGYALMRDMRSDPRTSGLVNSVICNSLIKGFGYEKSFDRAWKVYSEMKEAKMELTSMTFNTLIDACARSNEMNRLPAILEDMTLHRADLDQVSYNTIIKGLCHEKRLEEALELRKKMQSGGKHAVDAHAYGALLDGCSRLCKFQLGFDLLEAMLQEGVVPNNITLSSLVRLAGYSHQPWALERALSLCDELSRKHSIRLNWHVYKNLSKACIAHGDLQRALGFLAQAVKVGLKCDEDAYVAIILALATEKKTLMDAVSVLRLAAGLCVTRENLPTALVDIPAQNLRAHGGMSVQCVATVLTAIAALDQALAVTLVVELEREAGLHFDRQTKLRLTSSKVTAMHF